MTCPHLKRALRTTPPHSLRLVIPSRAASCLPLPRCHHSASSHLVSNPSAPHSPQAARYRVVRRREEPVRRYVRLALVARATSCTTTPRPVRKCSTKCAKTVAAVRSARSRKVPPLRLRHSALYSPRPHRHRALSANQSSLRSRKGSVRS